MITEAFEGASGNEAKMTGVTNTQLSSIGQIAMPVRDLVRGVEFYRDRLGLRFLFQVPPGLAFFDEGEGNTHALMQERRSLPGSG
jgi:catechol-2,3-dioxygenase